MVAATRKKPEILGRKISEFGFFPLRNADHKKRLGPPVRKKPAFLVGLYSGALVSSGHRSAPTEPAGETSWTLWGKSFVYARKLPQKSAQKKEWQASWFVYHTTVYEKNDRIPRGHFVTIVRGESVRNRAHKKARWSGSTPPLPLMGEYPPRGPARGRFSNSGGFCCKGGCFTQCRFPLQKEKGRGTMSTTR